MNKRLNYIHGAMLDYGAWLREGRTCQGIFSTSQWPEGRPKQRPAMRPVRRSHPQLIPITQPKETRLVVKKTPVIRIDYTSEKIHPIVVSFSEPLKMIVCYLYVRGLCFRDTAQALGMTSRQVGNAKHKVLKSIDNML